MVKRSGKCKRAAAVLILMGFRWHRRYWVHPVNQRHYELGEFHRLIQELRHYPDLFYTYFRMSVLQFDELKDKLKNSLKPMYSAYRPPISVEEKLAVCLRQVF